MDAASLQPIPIVPTRALELYRLFDAAVVARAYLTLFEDYKPGAWSAAQEWAEAYGYRTSTARLPATETLPPTEVLYVHTPHMSSVSVQRRAVQP